MQHIIKHELFKYLFNRQGVTIVAETVIINHNFGDKSAVRYKHMTLFSASVRTFRSISLAFATSKFLAENTTKWFRT